MLPHEFRDINQASSTTEEGDTPSTQNRRDASFSKDTTAHAGYPFPAHNDAVGPYDTSVNDSITGTAGGLSPSSVEAHNSGSNPEPWKQNPTQTLLSPVAEA